MMKFERKALNIALTAALAVSGLTIGQQAFANQDVTNYTTAASGALNGVGGSYVSNNQLGQALVYPYYTTRAGKSSLINVFNTSNKTVAIKVRFHESHNSRDVLDFTVVLSPFDKWSGTLKEASDGSGPVFVTGDNTCTSPAVPSAGLKLDKAAFTGDYADADPSDSVDRLREGYVEIIAMGQATDEADPVAVAAKHDGVTGVPASCSTVVNAFKAGTGTGVPVAGTGSFIPALYPAETYLGNGDPSAAAEFEAFAAGENPLRGALTIFSADSGVGFGTSAIAIADFMSKTEVDALGAGAAVARNLITAQALPYFLEPTLASRNGLWTTSGLADVEASMGADTIINEWANNSTNGAYTDWIIQFPTKSHHVDVARTATGACSDSVVQASLNHWRLGAATGAASALVAANGGGSAGDFLTCHANSLSGIAPVNKIGNITDAPLAPFENYFTATGSAMTVASMIYDKNERTTGNQVQFSPQPYAVPTIPWESNIVTFSPLDANNVLSSNSAELKFDPVGSLAGFAKNGMAKVSFPLAQAGYDVRDGSVGHPPYNLPVVGFVAKSRTQGDANRNYGQIMLHSYTGASQ